MWEKLGKVQLQNIAVMVILIGCFVMGIVAMVTYPPEQSERIVSKLMDISLLGAIGWLFTSNKGTAKKEAQ